MTQVYAANPVKQWGQLQVKGAQLCDQSGNPVVLRGVSLGWHNIWPRFYNKKAVKWLVQDWHANIIRAAMGIQIDDNYLENPDFALKCITQVVDAAIKQNLIPAEVTAQQASRIYASEADVLNVALFGMTALEWRDAHPDLKGNIRDYAGVNELICLSNMESLNAVLINEGLSQRERLVKLNRIAIQQMRILEDTNRKLLK
jgi:hypothetical protein